jgi:ATP-dependent DNA helicase PIF1
MLRYLEKSKSSHLPNYEEAKSKLIARGAKKQLIMFLSGAGGCGKSHVIGVAKQMCQHFCRSINEGFDFSSFLVTASTNSAAALIGGQTIHSVAQLRSKFHNVTINGKDITIHWVTANLIIIDEISMLSLDDFDKLDKHLRQLMREATKAESAPFGGLNIVLCGDFFQLNPVLAVPIYNRKRNVLWHLINSVIFCKGFNHRFKDDPEWGALLDRLRLGLLTEEDYDFLDTRVIGNDLSLPVTQPSDEHFLSYVCPTNAQRNQITDNNFDDLVRRTDRKSVV